MTEQVKELRICGVCKGTITVGSYVMTVDNEPCHMGCYINSRMVYKTDKEPPIGKV